MTISLLQKDQLDQFFELYESLVWSDFPDWDKDSKKVWLEDDYNKDFWLNALKLNCPILIATDSDTKLIGYVAVERVNFGVAYLGWIGILSDYRKKGIAKELIAKLKTECLKNGIHKIELETQLPELIPVFIRLGFSFEGNRTNSWQKLNNYMFGMSIS